MFCGSRVYGFGSRGVGVVRFGFRVFLGFGDLGWGGLRQLEHDMLVKQEGGVRAVRYCWPFFRTRLDSEHNFWGGF